MRTYVRMGSVLLFRRLLEEVLGCRKSPAESQPGLPLDGPIFVQHFVPEERLFNLLERLEDLIALQPTEDEHTHDVAPRARNQQLAHDTEVSEGTDEVWPALAGPWEVDVCLLEIKGQTRLVDQDERRDGASGPPRRPLDSIAAQPHADAVPEPFIPSSPIRKPPSQATRYVGRQRGAACRLGDGSDRVAWHYEVRLERILSLSRIRLGLSS
jgi:hypothetical protein